MKLILTSFLVFITHIAHTCDCKMIQNLRETQIDSYKTNELIFLAKVVESTDDGSYKLKIIELFKGTHTGSFIEGKVESSCSLYPHEEDGPLLIYTNPKADGTIDISSCGLSRSFKYPYTSVKGMPPLPPREGYNDKSIGPLENKQKELDAQKASLSLLKTEILQLRRWRDRDN